MKTAITGAGWIAAVATAGAAGYQWADMFGWVGVAMSAAGGYAIGQMLGAWTYLRHR